MEYGSVGFLDVLVSTHTRPGTSADEPPQWVDDRSASTFTSVSEEDTDPTQPIPFKPKVWKVITLEGRKKREIECSGWGTMGCNAHCQHIARMLLGPTLGRVRGSRLWKHAWLRSNVCLRNIGNNQSGDLQK